MQKKTNLTLLLSFFLSLVFAQHSPYESVNTFIGTGGHGHTYPGATVPFGMMQLSPDTRLTGWDGCSGYHYTDEVIYGFSHTHLSGTGVSDLGDILLMPTTGEIRLNNGADGTPGYRSSFDKETEKASPGHYQCYLEDYKVGVDLWAGKRAGFHEYSFDDKTAIANLIVDLKHRDELINGGLSMVNNKEIEGFRISNAWAREQHVYFVAKFSEPMIAEATIEGEEALVYGFQFKLNEDRKLKVKVGISAVSIEGARKNLEAEIKGWNGEALLERAKKEWNQALSKIDVKSTNDDDRKIFYSALYHTMIVPNLYQDVDGQYRGMDLKIHQAKDHDNYTIFSLWDTYRATHPLYTILEQERTNEFIKTFLDQYDKGSILPIWELNANYTGCMIGYHAIPVIADAYKKGIRGYDVEKALVAMQHSAEQDHLGLFSYKKKGYVMSDQESESVSKTLEYAYDDWCIAMMAEEMGEKDIAANYLKRAQYYKNIFDPTTGFMRAKRNNTWVEPFEAAEVNFHFTEANSWQYSFYAPQDIEGLIKLHGGRAPFERKLDELFSTNSETSGRHQVDITGLIGQYAHGNEPSHHMAYLYNYIAKPWKTQKLVRQIMSELYHNQPDGLSGNEDCGQMSAWYVFSAMGFYPVTPGDNTYIIGSPIFPELSLNLENGNTFTITADKVSDKNIYIQNVSLNGEAYTKSFIKHEDVMSGGTLAFEMGAKPNKSWGTEKLDIPSSSISKEEIIPLPFVSKTPAAFMDKASVVLGHADPEAEIFYTSVISGPMINAIKYTGPIVIDKTSSIRFFAEKDRKKSKIVKAKFFKVPEKRKIKLKTTYAAQYAAGGDYALIDYLRGTKDFRTGTWQGYEGIDMEAVVDLGKKQALKRVALGCLQDQNSWIFMPEEVRISVSSNGKKFRELAIMKNDIEDEADGGILKEFEFKGVINARYIKVEAVNRKTVPEWHKGAGGKAWIFVDEIILE